MTLAQLVATGTDAIETVLESGAVTAVADALIIAKRMKAVAVGGAKPVQADFDVIDTTAEPYLTALNDKTKDA